MDDEFNPYRTPAALGETEAELCVDGVAVRIKSVRLRANFTLACLGLNLLAESGVMLARDIPFASFLFRPLAGKFTPMEIVVWVSIALAILRFIWFMMWVFRSAQNAKLLEGRGSSISPGMAVGSYFIPIYNWVGPMLALKRVVQVIQRFAKGPAAWVGVWWTSWILGSVIGLVYRFSGTSDSWYALQGSKVLYLLLTATLVIQLTRQQMLLFRNPPVMPGVPRTAAGARPPSISRGMPRPQLTTSFLTKG